MLLVPFRWLWTPVKVTIGVTALILVAIMGLFNSPAHASINPQFFRAQTARITCYAYGRHSYLAQPGAGVSSVSNCTLTVYDELPMSSGRVMLVLRAPDGAETSWLIAS